MKDESTMTFYNFSIYFRLHYIRPEFIERLLIEQGTDDMLPAQKMKLLNINAVAKFLTSNYNGPFLKPESSAYDCPFGYRKNKKVLFQGLLDTLKNLFTKNSHIRTEHDSKLGFIIGKFYNQIKCIKCDV